MTAATAGRWRGTGAAGQLAVLTAHSLRALVADRRVAVFLLLQPLVLLVLFVQVIGTIVDPRNLPDGLSYVDYLLPAILVTTGIAPAVNAGTSLVRDMDGGILNRYRSMPVTPFWVLCSRGLADLTRVAVQLGVVAGGGVLLFGHVPRGGPLAVVAAILVALVVVWSLMWVFLALAAWLRSMEIMQSLGFLVMPLMFASNAFVPVERLPGWLEVVAVVNPITYAVNATRSLTRGLPDAPVTVLAAVGVAAAILAVAMVCADRGFRRTTLAGS